MMEVHEAWLADVDGEPNQDGIYLGCLLPVMEALDGAGQPLTATQKMLALAGIAHLEILNGGFEQLSRNYPTALSGIPKAIADLGSKEKAQMIARAIESGKMDQDTENEVADFLQSRVFFGAIATAVKGDLAGYKITKGDGSRTPNSSWPPS